MHRALGGSLGAHFNKLRLGCFFAQWRAQRSAAIHGQRPRSRAKVRDALNKRLRLAVLHDRIRCRGQLGFERRWRPFIAIDDQMVSFVNLPPLKKVGSSED